MKQFIKQSLAKITIINLAQLVLLLTAFTPLMRTDFSLFPFVFGKSIYFFSLVSLACVLVAIDCLIRPQKWYLNVERLAVMWKSNTAPKLLCLLLVSLLVSTLLSKNVYVSFWGTLDRLDGFIQFFYYALFAVMAVVVFEKKQWITYAKLNIITVLVLCIVAWLERFSVLSYASQPGSLIGSSTFLAAYLIIASTYVATQIRIGEVKKWYLKFALVLFYMLGFVTVIITGTKGAFLGLCGGGLVYLVSVILKKESPKLNRAIATVGLLLFVGFVGVFFVTKNNPVWLKIPTITRFASLTANSNSLQSRVISWEAGIKGFQERWIVGWGSEEFLRVFNTYGSPKIARHTDGWFDKSHNKYIEVLVSQGIVGFILYMTLLAVMLRALWPNALALSFFVAFILQNFFIFDTIVTYPLFMLLVPVASRLKHVNTASVRPNHWKVRGALLVIIIASVYTLVTNLFVFKQQLAFDAFVHARSPHERSIKLNEILYPINPSQTKVRMQLLEFFLTALQPTHPVDIETFVKAVQSMEEVLPYGDGDPRYAIDLAESYYYLRLVDKTYASKADEYANSVLLQTPLTPKGYYLFILMGVDARRFEPSIEFAKKAVALDEGNARAQLNLATALITAGSRDANPYYNENDKKFADWLNAGHEALRKSYDLASRKLDGSTAITALDFTDTQFVLFHAVEVQNMFEFAVKFNEVDLMKKIERVAEYFNVPLEKE